ncbi:mitochondrial pyruvate carrier 4 [Hevea brasiliensis]|uniref:mitochondrial pyruvate carrier 4 n=1 Tax=Hevea brasiliensis TaxID=3981 RepID=UPI0025FC79EB|nr:mitochondrial pyruvate carrier 4 [Hevea brasiliensis]
MDLLAEMDQELLVLKPVCTVSSISLAKFHFWAPTFKWVISLANVADFSKPPEVISYPQQIAVTGTGLIWSRYSMVITPKNWNLFSVNVAMAATGLYQISRKLKFIQNPYLFVLILP